MAVHTRCWQDTDFNLSSLKTQRWVQAVPLLGSWMSCFCLASSRALLPRAKPWREEKSPAGSCSRVVADGCPGEGRTVPAGCSAGQPGLSLL